MMLVDFWVENYRSVKDGVTLSAIELSRGPGKVRQGTGKRRGIKTDEEIAPAHPVPGRDFALLPALAIFGANESGKTTILRALDDLLWLMTDQAGASERLVPFRLDADSAASPTGFRLRVALEGSVYIYSLRMDRRRVYQESLECLPPGEKEACAIFRRQVEGRAGRPTFHLDESVRTLIGEEPRDLRAQQTLMSLLADYETLAALSPLAEWLRKSLRGVSLGYENLEREIATYWAREQDLAREAFVRLLRDFDLSIIDLEVRPSCGGKKCVEQVIVYHETPQGRVSWPLEDESLGTRRLFELAPKLLWTLHHGSLALFDELGTNLHPYVTERIVRLFQSPETNPRRGQLIFTSHDNTLLQNQLLRRDQVWLTEKRPDGSTDVYSVSDFRARNDLALDKAYLDGRFGAVPVLPAAKDMVAAGGRPD